MSPPYLNSSNDILKLDPEQEHTYIYIYVCVSVCVSVSVHKVWFNGLPTHFRLHLAARPCPFCRRPDSVDRLTHVVHCMDFWKSYAEAQRCQLETNLMQHLAIKDDTNASDRLIALHILVDTYQDLNNQKVTHEVLVQSIRDSARRLSVISKSETRSEQARNAEVPDVPVVHPSVLRPQLRPARSPATPGPTVPSAGLDSRNRDSLNLGAGQDLRVAGFAPGRRLESR